MASPKRSKGHPAFHDLTNIRIPSGVTKNNVRGSMTPNVHPPSLDRRERKRQWDRDRYAQMPVQQKEELLEKRREARRWKKSAASIVTAENHQFSEEGITRTNENIAPDKDNGWLHGNDMYGRNKVPTPLRGDNSLIDIQLQGKNCCNDKIQGLTNAQIESRRAKDGARYANMTPKQRQAIRDRQNARIMKPAQKQAKRDRDKVRRNTLHKDSIAMVNPYYNSMEDSP